MKQDLRNEEDLSNFLLLFSYFGLKMSILQFAIENFINFPTLVLLQVKANNFQRVPFAYTFIKQIKRFF